MAGLTEGPDPSTPEVLRAWVVDLVDRVAELDRRLKLAEAREGWAVSMLENEVMPRLAQLDRQIEQVPDVVDRVMGEHDAVLKAKLDQVLEVQKREADGPDWEPHAA